jgi:hypothetical protein
VLAAPRAVREMIFISRGRDLSGVFFLPLVKPTAGDPMTKLIVTALLSVGLATAAMAADMPKSAAPTAADAPAAGSAPAKAASGKKHSKKKKATPAPSTTK